MKLIQSLTVAASLFFLLGAAMAAYIVLQTFMTIAGLGALLGVCFMLAAILVKVGEKFKRK